MGSASGAIAPAAEPAGGNNGYFSGLRAAKDAANAGKSSSAEIIPTRAEMSATVKAAARAAALRLAASDKGNNKSAAAAAAGSAGFAGGAAAGAGGGAESDRRIERDIFAGRPSRGQALGVSAGGYDVYPETGDFETYDSDEVRDEGLRERKYACVFVCFLPSSTGEPCMKWAATHACCTF